MPKKLPAIALLMTLSMLTMVMLVVVNITQKSAQELELITNEQQLFHLKRETNIIIKALVSAIREFGANQLYHSVGLIIPDNNFGISLIPEWPDILIKELTVQSLDHYYFINRENYNFINQTTQQQLIIFRNIFQNYAKENSQNFESDYINEFIGQLSDWIDYDNNITSNNFLYGAESYIDSKPTLEPKNAKLDSLTELYLLPGFNKMNILDPGKSVFDIPIRIIALVDPSKQCDIGPLNLNMLPPDEQEAAKIINQFIDSVEGVSLQRCGYSELIQNRFRLVELISQFVDNQSGPVFSSPLRSDETWGKLVSQLGSSQIKTKLDGLFTARSDILEIKFLMQINNYQKPYRLHLVLNYKNQSQQTPRSVIVKYLGNN